MSSLQLDCVVKVDFEISDELHGEECYACKDMIAVCGYRMVANVSHLEKQELAKFCSGCGESAMDVWEWDWGWTESL